MISQDSLRYVGIFLRVYRVRPRDPEDDARSDEDFDDVKLELDETNVRAGNAIACRWKRI